MFFVAAYLIYKKLEKMDIFLCGALGLFAIGFILVFPYIVFDVAVLKYVVLAYAVIISAMIAVGSVLFFISDMMLLLAWFSTIEGRWTSNVCMAAYYPALCLLAGSMVVYMKKIGEEK